MTAEPSKNPHQPTAGPATAPELLSLARAWKGLGNGVAIARVLETWGSAPRPVGSILVIRDDELFAGSVSGGCIEGEVIASAKKVIESGVGRIMEFGISNSDAWQVGLACGGKIKILLEALDEDWLKIIDGILNELNAGRPALILSDLDGIKSRLAPFDQTTQATTDKDRSFTENNTFHHVLNRPLEMIIIGAVHIAQALAPMATLAGFDVSVIDPRGAFAMPERFAGIALIEDWPDDVLSARPPHSRTAVITLTHDPKLDDAALKAALNSPAFYIGSLGSKKTHAARLARLAQAGFDAASLNRIHGPVGLDIGAQSASEIAVAALAQVIQCLRQMPEPRS